MVTRAVSSWSLHRTLGRFKSPDSPSHGALDVASPIPTSGLSLLDLPAELRARGYDAVQICHFHLPSRSSSYLDELRAALAESQIDLDALLVDDGDLTSAHDADAQEAWIAGWLDVAVHLGSRRARLCAGRSAPTEETLRESARRLVRLAESHPDVRIVTENWMESMPNADSVLTVLRETGDAVGLMIDLGNWSGPGKYRDLAAIAPFAETCHAKCHFTGHQPDSEDFRTSLQILKDAEYDGPLALIYDGRDDDDEWGCLDREYDIVREVFA